MLSVVIITKNESKNIEQCLESVKWADEIIVIDANSSDGTAVLAKKFTKNVFSRDWQGYGNAKNYGIEKACGDWILSIDADERVTEKLKAEIKGIINSPKCDGYSIPRLLYFCGKPVKFGGCYPDYQLRLFKKQSGRFNDLEVHEGIELRGNKGYLKNHIDHYSYATIEAYWERFNIYTTLDAKKKKRQNKKTSFFVLYLLPWECLRRLVFKAGILDGFPGVFYHIFSAVSSVVKYAKLWELNNDKK
ncbi:MAG: glycosyltransferase family 2 protein [Elusimicrobiota bacterium]